MEKPFNNVLLVHNNTELKVHASKCDNVLMKKSELMREKFSERLKKALALNKKDGWGSGAYLKEITGVTQKAANKWLNGESIPNKEKLTTISKRLGVNSAWLEYGEGEIRVSQNNLSSNNQSNIKSLNSETAKMFSYPLIEWDDIESFLDRRLSPTKFRSIVVSIKNIDSGFWLEVTDDLMSCLSSPSFPEGSLILVDPNINKIENGKFLLIEHKDEKLFRQIVKNSGTTYLKTLNDKYLPVPINDNECKVLGKIVGLYIEILD